MTDVIKDDSLWVSCSGARTLDQAGYQPKTTNENASLFHLDSCSNCYANRVNRTGRPWCEKLEDVPHALMAFDASLFARFIVGLYIDEKKTIFEMLDDEENREYYANLLKHTDDCATCGYWIATVRNGFEPLSGQQQIAQRSIDSIVTDL